MYLESLHKPLWFNIIEYFYDHYFILIPKKTNHRPEAKTKTKQQYFSILCNLPIQPL